MQDSKSKKPSAMLAFFTGISLVFQFFSILYFALLIRMNVGIKYVNVITCCVCVAYTVIYLVSLKLQSKSAKKMRATAKLGKRAVKLTLRLITLLVSLYGIAVAINSVSPFTVAFAIICLVGWVMQVTVELIAYLIRRRLSRFLISKNKA